jgi:outer membrane protein OmpA-like peptidoglycan-associated protein
VFVCKINVDGSFTTPVNVGAPVNDTTDDFAFYIDSKTRKGFFSSNRPSGKGFDDIYSFVETSILKYEHEINGMVTDETTSQVIPFAKVLLLDSKMQKLAEGASNQNGEYKFAVSCGEVYYIQAVNADYEVKEIKVIVPNKNGSTMVPIVISKKVIVLKVNDDISKMLKLKNIYFDLDKALVRNDAALELEMVLDVMNQYPTIKIDVRSHTDSRQSSKYNEGLSDRRAKATIAWLIKNGITADRLTGKGYGESELLNSCADGASCTEEEHQANRRSEFIIVKL